MKVYIDTLIGVFSDSISVPETATLLVGGIWLILGIITVFRGEYLARGIFGILDAIIFTPAALLALNMNLSAVFWVVFVLVALLLNMLNWLISCQIDFEDYIKGFGLVLVALALFAGVVLPVGAAMLKEMLNLESLAAAVPFLAVLVLFLPEVVAFFFSGPTSDWTPPDKDPLYWLTGDEDYVDTTK